MAKKNSLKEVPFQMRWSYEGDRRVDQGWDMTAYPESWAGEVQWRPNEPFQKSLELVRLERGRSAARFWWRDEDGVNYPMFGQGLTDMLQQVTLVKGWVHDEWWIGVKRGANYGIERYET